MTAAGASAATEDLLPDAVRETLDDFAAEFDVAIALWIRGDSDRGRELYRSDPSVGGDCSERVSRSFAPKDGPELQIEVLGSRKDLGDVAAVLLPTVERVLDYAHEVRFFTFELAERYEEINLLYSISETLGSILRLDDAARAILEEVCDVLGANRGSLWVHDGSADLLRLTASVGTEGFDGPIAIDHPDSVTARAFRESRPLIMQRDQDGTLHGVSLTQHDDSFLSVPIRYSPPAGEPRTVGVINVIGRRHGGRFTASDQKLLSAIASQVGAALENNRLIQDSLARERVTREMELAHNLQMKLLPPTDRIEGVDIAARVQPADSVGGDFYHLFQLAEGRTGVMIGDVSGHGFPAALIMALSMSAASIYASEFGSPTKVLRHIDDALREELQNTEMYLTLFYGVVDREAGTLMYANAGHPHAFCVRTDGKSERLGAIDPPIGFTDGSGYGESTVSFEAGDTLFLFTDGLSEPLTTNGGEKGEVRLLRSLSDRCEESLDCVISALFSLEVETPSDGDMASVPPADDRTALLLRV